MKTLYILLSLSCLSLFSGFVLSDSSASKKLSAPNLDSRTRETPPSSSRQPSNQSNNSSTTETLTAEFLAAEIVPSEKTKAQTKEETKDLKPSPLVAAVRNDQLCELMIQMETETLVDPKHAYEFLQEMGTGEELQKIFSLNGPLYGDSDLSLGKTIPEKFLFALRLAEIYSVRSPKSKDLKRARKILLELEKEEPGNAAFPFFRFLIEKRDQVWKDELEKTLKSFHDKSYFDTYLFSLLKDLESQKWRSGTYHFAVSNFSDYVKIPYYQPAQEILEFDRKNKTEYGKIVGQLMMQDGRRAKRAHTLGGFCSAQYEWGRNVSLSDELDSYRLSRQIEGWEENFSFPYPPYVDRNRCDPEPYENFVREARKNL